MGIGPIWGITSLTFILSWFLTYTKLQLEENVLVKIRNFTLDSALLLFRMFGDFTNSTPGECPLQEIYPSPLAPFPLPCPGEADERIKWLKKKGENF